MILRTELYGQSSHFGVKVKLSLPIFMASLAAAAAIVTRKL